MKNLATLTLGVLLLAPAGFAQAGRDRDWRDDGRYNSNSAVERGYQDGVRQGQLDRSRRSNGNYRNRDWKQGDRGYERSMGAKGQYKKAYREGYERGYEAGYNGAIGNNGRRGRNGGYGDNGVYDNNGGYGNNALAQSAYQNGMQSGAFYAQQDRSRGNAYNPTGAKGYRDADQGYNDNLGSKAEFQRIFREAFVRGYQQAYGNTGGGYPNTGYPNPQYPNNGGYNANALIQAAQQNGLQSGAYYAQQDRSRGNAYNPTATKGYRDADQGYTDNLGSKADYQRIFRENFVRGYQQAFGNAGYRR